MAVWTPLSRAYESVRPEPADLLGLPPPGLDVNWGYAWFWEHSQEFTEGALTRAALQSDHVAQAAEQEAEPDALPLSVDATLDLFVGALAAPPVLHVANLGRDAPEAIYAKMAAHLRRMLMRLMCTPRAATSPYCAASSASGGG